MTSTFINTHPGVVLFNAIQFVSLLGVYKGEIDNPMQYSKFAMGSTSGKKSNAKVPSKVGMLIIYVPATIVGFVFQCVLPYIPSLDYTRTTAGWMILAHFLKRDAEVLYVHKYSGDTELNTARLIGLSYAVNSFVICLLSNFDSWSSNIYCKYGTILFVIGSLGNLYHHYLLALLRSKGNGNTQVKEYKKEYKAPKGGLFEYVAAPHYLFELIAWLGITVSSQQLTTLFIFSFMTCYLSARAYNQNQWNRKKFDEKDWPKSRKHLVPFVY